MSYNNFPSGFASGFLSWLKGQNDCMPLMPVNPNVVIGVSCSHHLGHNESRFGALTTQFFALLGI